MCALGNNFDAFSASTRWWQSILERLQRREQIVDGKWLAQKGGGAKLEDGRRVFMGTRHRNYRYTCPGWLHGSACKHLPAIHARHLHVQEDDIRQARGQRRNRVEAISSSDDVPALTLQRELEQRADFGVILHEQDETAHIFVRLAGDMRVGIVVSATCCSDTLNP